MTHPPPARLLSPQCQPQAVVFDPENADDGAKQAEEECPTKAINLNAQPTEDTVKVSDIVIATGYHEMQPVNVDEYNYGKHPNIITQLELAKIIDPNGESGGALVKPSDGKPAKRVLVRGRTRLAAQLRLAPGLVLHGEDGAYTPAAEAVLRDGTALEL